MDRQSWLTERFEENRPRLRAVAYRMLGSANEADNAVQEAWLRLSGIDAANIENPGLEMGAAAHAHAVTRAVEARLKTLEVPTLIVWGTDDVYFDVKWSQWLADMIPGTRRRVEFDGARLFFPEERWAEFNQELRAHWDAAASAKW